MSPLEKACLMTAKPQEKLLFALRSSRKDIQRNRRNLRISGPVDGFTLEMWQIFPNKVFIKFCSEFEFIEVDNAGRYLRPAESFARLQPSCTSDESVVFVNDNWMQEAKGANALHERLQIAHVLSKSVLDLDGCGG